MRKTARIHLFGATMMLGCFAAAPVDAAENAISDYFKADATCYGRTYSAEHLAKHPHQKVMEIVLNHATKPQEKAWLGEAPLTKPVRVMRLLVLMKGQEQHWEEFAGCELEGDKVQCGLECDAGQFSVALRDDGRLLLTPADQLWFTQCDAGEAVLDPEPDDRSFLLDPMPLDACIPQKYLPN